MNSPRVQRGQVYSTDALLSLVLFAFALAIISGLTAQLSYRASAQTSFEHQQQYAQMLAESLLFSHGDPVYWNKLSDKNNVYQVGLVENGSSISPVKWSALRDWNASDYPSLKQALGISSRDFYLTISDVNKNILTTAGTAPVDSNTVNVVVLPSVYNNAAVLVRLQVFG